ncbi:hypothetical protein N9J04_01140 [Candidatus Pelagibacter sp.]|nr:hypothetical protein [Candidatus Pelagibacter sp.]
MKFFTKKILPKQFVKNFKIYRILKKWGKNNFLENAPQLIKEFVFEKYGLVNAPWVETGTFLGNTTNFLRDRYPHVYTIEPEIKLYNAALKRFNGKNVTLYNDVSENVFPKLLKNLSGNINFWLDGHYSEGITFKGKTDCPVEDELNSIEVNLNNFNKITILIDDVRCFLPENSKYSDYPSIDYLVDWARRFNMRWRIEHDIFVIQKD